MKKDNIPIQTPEFGMSITYSNVTGEITAIDLDWKKFLKKPKEWQIRDLKWILEEVEKSPEERKRWMQQAAKDMGTKTRLAGLEKDSYIV